MSANQIPPEQLPQHDDVQSQNSASAADVVDRPFQIGDGLPMRMLAADMQRIFGIGSARFYALAKRGDFDVFEILPKIGPRAWSGERVAAYLRGEAVFTRSFGRKVRHG